LAEQAPTRSVGARVGHDDARENGRARAELEAMRPKQRAGRLRRGDVYRRPVVDGCELSDGLLARLWRWLEAVTTSAGEREEAELDARLRRPRRLTRTNTVAVVSPKGGVGKTTCTFALGNLIASHLRKRVLALDANPDFGTLASLAPDRERSEKTMLELVEDLDRLRSAPELEPYVSPLSSGLHVLAAPRPEVMAEMTPELYGQLLAFIGRYYDVVCLDLGTGVHDPLAQFALSRSDQALVVSEPDFVTTEKVLKALDDLSAGGHWEDGAGERGERLTVVLNKAPAASSGDRQVVEAAFRGQGIARLVTIPADRRLRVMLDSATYALEALPRATRMPIKQLGESVAERLV